MQQDILNLHNRSLYNPLSYQVIDRSQLKLRPVSKFVPKPFKVTTPSGNTFVANDYSFTDKTDRTAASIEQQLRDLFGDSDDEEDNMIVDFDALDNEPEIEKYHEAKDIKLVEYDDNGIKLKKFEQLVDYDEYKPKNELFSNIT